MSTLIVGCGYLGRRVGRLLVARREPVYGTTRSPANAVELRAMGIEPVLADVLEPSTLRLPRTDHVVSCVGLDRMAGVPMRTVYVQGLKHVLEAIAGLTGCLVYASSTGVYGQDDGRWVDEDSPAEPRHESGRVCLEAEEVARSFAGSKGPAILLRYSGLYGPGRTLRRATLERGEPVVGDPARFLNMVHIDDAATATVAALDRGEAGRIYLVSDDRPVERHEYYELAAEILKLPAPRFVPPAPGRPEPQREGSNKRVSNRRMRTELGVTLAYPDITTGIPAALAAD